MFKVGDYTRHRETGRVGKVIGYGHQMLEGVYLPTLKVQLIQGQDLVSDSFVEDVVSTWVQLEGDPLEEQVVFN